MNKLLLLIVVVVFLVVGGLIIKLSSDDDEQGARVPPTHDEVSAVGETHPDQTPLTDAERDSYVNTIKTINARYRDLESRFHELMGKQAQVEKVIPTDQDIDEVIDRRVSDSANQLMRDFQKRLNAVKGDLEQKMQKSSSSTLPKGLGFDDLIKGAGSRAGTTGTGSGALRSDWSTVLPMGSTEASAGGEKSGGLLGWYSQASQTKPARPASAVRPAVASKQRAAEENDEDEEPIPVYTIPRNATLFDNDTLTALLGVIPVEGSILDPVRFKLITGGTNLATNGLFIPGVKNIVWSGIAIGNREMSCVRGELHSVTFTFEDGTIRTVSASKSSSDTNRRSKRILGYISDRRGSPCIEGQLITNASDYLRDRMIAAGAGATASAFSSTQERTVTRSDGSSESYFFGDDTGKYIGSKALAGGLGELSQYLAERSRNAVDLVYVEAGQQVVLHVEDQIEIDYDPNGRRLAYEHPLSFADHNITGLD